MSTWKPNSWKNKPSKHLPEYKDQDKLNNVLKEISNFPPLVFAGESRSLKDHLAKVSQGKAFLLQGGDCAESFAEFHPNNIRDFFKLFLQMSLVLTVSSGLPIVKLGRIAGQF
jgi:3-deoxy-7-phosphoheptulonate synthase